MPDLRQLFAQEELDVLYGIAMLKKGEALENAEYWRAGGRNNLELLEVAALWNSILVKLQPAVTKVVCFRCGNELHNGNCGFCGGIS